MKHAAQPLVNVFRAALNLLLKSMSQLKSIVFIAALMMIAVIEVFFIVVNLKG